MRQRENMAKSEELWLLVLVQWKQAPHGSDSSLTHTVADWRLLCAHAFIHVAAGINISQSSLVPPCQQPALSRFPDSTTENTSSEAADLAGPQCQLRAPVLSLADVPPLLDPVPPTTARSHATWGGSGCCPASACHRLAGSPLARPGQEA